MPPRILNEDEVRLATERFYPPHLREQGIGGTVRVYFLVDADGMVVRRVLDRGSGVPELDDAAMQVSEVHRFAPATNRDIPVPVWVSFAVTFGASLTGGQHDPRAPRSRDYGVALSIG